MSFSTSRNHAMLEEINMGYEINVMSWIKDGKAYFMEFGDRETSGATARTLPYLTREIFPSYYYHELKDTVVQYLEKIAAYIGIQEGPLSMQFFYNNHEITIGEVAGRFFGLGQGIVPVINGIDLNDLLINMIYFTEDNVENFISNPIVKPSIQAKQKAIISDFLNDNKKTKNQICSILDLCISETEAENVCNQFCNFINQKTDSNIKFSYEKNENNIRIILSGDEDCIIEILNSYYKR